MVPFIGLTTSCPVWPSQWQLFSTKENWKGEGSLFTRYTVSLALDSEEEKIIILLSQLYCMCTNLDTINHEIYACILFMLIHAQYSLGT